MECLKWQERGLLFVSGETDAGQNEEFKEHVKVCAECKKEMDEYYYDKKNFFSQDVLAETPPEAIDTKIIAACSQKPMTTLGFNLFSGLWMKKALLSTFFLVFGMGAGIYFTVHYFSTDTAGTALSNPAKATEAGVAASDQKSSTVADQALKQIKNRKEDSVAKAKKDSLNPNEAPSFPSSQRPAEGIVPVDLNKE